MTKSSDGTLSAPAGPAPDPAAGRVAEVIVTTADGERRRGSGYRVATGAVLTAAHVVAGARAVRVRFDAARPTERVVEAVVAWRHADTDTAVLTIACPDPVETASFGRVGESAVVMSCGAVGFPRFKMRAGSEGARYRDSEHVHATCAVLSNRKEGTLDLNVTPPAAGADPGASPWEGMSGAVVFSAGRIVGVVSRHHLSDGPGRLAAGRVDRWAERLSATELRELEALLGSGLTPDALPDVVTPSAARGATGMPFGARLLDLAPAELRERDDELARLAEFCAGADPYAWVQAPPWAGKTALAAWFALHPPSGVLPVWFFVTARLAGHADHAAFTEALTHQLAMIAGREPARHASATGRDDEWRLLLREAAERLARDGRTLLLIVDGLDEDRSAAVGGPSIAALLPQRPPPNVRVLVTSRPGPGLPADVPGTHPLRHCDPVTLLPVDAARHTEHEAVHELSVVLGGDDLDHDLVGLLAAARSELTLPDLYELTGRAHPVLKKRLAGGFGRILRRRADGAGARGYLFAHETMLTAALRELGPDIAGYRERVHAWARRYAEAGWLPGTPAYLLQPYGRMVASLDDPGLGTALATDRRRHDRMRAAYHSDVDALAEIDAVTAAVARSAPGALGPPAALAAARHLLTLRNAFVPAEMPVALAALGRTDRAITAAHRLTEPVNRAEALARIARILADRDDPRAVDTARLAVLLANAEETDPQEVFDTPRTLLTAATALMVTGHDEDALRALDSSGGWVSVSPAEALAELAVAAHPRDAVLSAKLLGEAVAEARKEKGAERIAALADVARTCAPVDGKLSKDLYRRIRKAARKASEESDDVDLLATAATALRDTDPELAADLAENAVSIARSHLGDAWNPDEEYPSLHGPYEATVDAVTALLAAGLVADAQQVLESARSRSGPFGPPAPLFLQEWADVAMGWAHRGRADEAWNAIVDSWSGFMYMVRDADGTAEMVRTLARAGASERVEFLARADTAERPWVAAEALAALAGHHAADDPERAGRLLTEAQVRAERIQAIEYTPDQLATLAVALAVTGRYGDAERLARTVTRGATRAWALAGLSLAHAEEGSPHAPRLAQEAADTLEGLGTEDRPGTRGKRTPHADEELEEVVQLALEAGRARLRPRRAQVGAVVRALGFMGDAAQAEKLIALHGGRSHRSELRLAAATGLWQYAPAEACDIVSDEELPLRGGPVRWDETAPEFARLIVAVGHQDPPRGERLRQAADRAARRCLPPPGDPLTGSRPRGLVIAGLLGLAARPAADDPPAPTTAQILEALDHAPFRRSSGHLVAVLHAALGDYRSAARSVREAGEPVDRATALTELAAYVAGARGLPMTAEGERDEVPAPADSDEGEDVMTLIRRLAALVAPPELADGREGWTVDGPGIITPAVRRSVAGALLAEALQTPGWHRALPVVADLDPDGITQVRDVVFAHLGLAADPP